MQTCYPTLTDTGLPESSETTVQHTRPRFRKLNNQGTGPLFSFSKSIEIKEIPLGGSIQKALFAIEPIPKDTIIYEADPSQQETRPLTRSQLEKMDEKTKKRWWVYCWQLDENTFSGPRTDIPLEEALGRDALNFINHSCDPNIGFDGDDFMVMLRDVEAGEMICYDYAMSDTEATLEASLEFECECGSEWCRGRIRANDYLIPEVMQRYHGRFLSYVKKKQMEVMLLEANVD